MIVVDQRLPDASGLEFIEVVNDGPTVADLSGWFFSEGVQYIFPSGTFLPAGEHVVGV